MELHVALLWNKILPIKTIEIIMWLSVLILWRWPQTNQCMDTEKSQNCIIQTVVGQRKTAE